MARQKVLFVCDENRLRSPTAQALYSKCREVPCRPLDLRTPVWKPDATVPVTEDLLEWADIVFVMEKRQRNVIHKKWREQYTKKRIVCLYIPDEYDFMEPALVKILRRKLEPYLGRPV